MAEWRRSSRSEEKPTDSGLATTISADFVAACCAYVHVPAKATKTNTHSIRRYVENRLCLILCSLVSARKAARMVRLGRNLVAYGSSMSTQCYFSDQGRVSARAYSFPAARIPKSRRHFRVDSESPVRGPRTSR